MKTFLSIPFSLLGVLCLLLAVIFFFFWPRGRVIGPEVGTVYYIIRWFHSLVWVCLGISFFLRGKAPGPANLIALAGLMFYLVFLAALLKK